MLVYAFFMERIKFWKGTLCLTWFLESIFIFGFPECLVLCGLSAVVANGGFSCCRARALGRQASVVAACQLRSCGTQPQLPCSMGDLPRPGIEPMSPALAGRLPTTGLPGKSCLTWFLSFFFFFKVFLLFIFFFFFCFFSRSQMKILMEKRLFCIIILHHVFFNYSWYFCLIILAIITVTFSRRQEFSLYAFYTRNSSVLEIVLVPIHQDKGKSKGGYWYSSGVFN